MSLGFEELKLTFASGKTIPYEWRLDQLHKLKAMVKDNESDFVAALAKDLHRGKFEAVAAELIPFYSEVELAISNLKKWMKPEYTSVPAIFSPATSEIRNVPLGVILIIGPFNYPINLSSPGRKDSGM